MGSNKRKPVTVKAIIYIKGFQAEAIFGHTLDSVRKRAHRCLTLWKPGGGSLYPSHIVLFTRTEASRWQEVEQIAYKDIPLHDCEWFKQAIIA